MSQDNRKAYQATDADLLRTARSEYGSEPARRAAGELLQRYQRPVYVWCFRYVRNHDGALELAQDVLAAAYSKLESFGGRCQFSTWLFAIARNRCINEVKRVNLLVDEATDLEGVADKVTPAVDQEFEYQQDEKRLLALIESTLEPLEREAMWLRCIDRMPIDEITRLLNIEASSGARGILQTARRKLRVALNNAGDLEK